MQTISNEPFNRVVELTEIEVRAHAIFNEYLDAGFGIEEAVRITEGEVTLLIDTFDGRAPYTAFPPVEFWQWLGGGAHPSGGRRVSA